MSIGATQFVLSQGFSISGLTPSYVSPLTPCDSILTMQFSAVNPLTSTTSDVAYVIQGSNFTSSALTVVIDWGDGNTTTHQGTASVAGQPISFNPPIWHMYPQTSSPVNYTVLTTVANISNQSYAIDTLIHTVTQCSNPSSPLYGVLNVDCDSNGVTDTTIMDFPIFLSGQGLAFTTQFVNGMAFVGNIPSGSYTWSVDPGFLQQFGYTLFSYFPTTLVLGPPTTIVATVFCDNIPQIGCTNGFVFCDNNNNGSMDGGDFGIPNVPVFAMYNGLMQSTITGNNGGYSFDYILDSLASPAIITVNAAWLGQNGYQITNTTAIDTAMDCLPTSTQFFAVNCDSATIQNECVTGWVFCDANSNGVLDINESGLAFAPVTLMGNFNNSITVYTDSNGVFTYSGQAYLGSIVVASIPTWWLTQHGYTLTQNAFSMTTNCTNPMMAYFAVNCSPVLCADLWTSVTPWIGYYQNTTNSIKVKWGNNGPNATTGYTLTLTYPSSVTPNLSTIQYSNYVVSGNTITWTFGPGSSYIYETDIIYFSVPAGYPSGTAHSYSTVITPLGSTTDCNGLNNDGSLCMILGNSYDPNDKSVSLQPILDPGTQEELTYVVRFQNTGTAPAQDVYIIDTLSSNLDWSTLKVISTSHNMQLIDLGNGVMKFNFPGIWLPDSTSNEPASHGDVVFSVKENTSNTVGSEIENTAHIYFDWNPAIVTNTTYNVNAYLGIEEEKQIEVSIYPNPAENLLHVVSNQWIEKVVVVDLMGKEILTQNMNNVAMDLDLSALNSGTYLLQMISNDQVSTKRFVKK